MDGLDKETFTCMCCGEKFKAIDGTWPQNYMNGEPMIDSEHNDRSGREFVCYDCAD